MHELRPGLWRWTAPHPEWREGADWDRTVGCFAQESGDGLVLIDPLVDEGDWGPIEELAGRRGEVAAVALTVQFHERDSAEAARRYDVPLFTPADGSGTPVGVDAVVVPEAQEALLYLAGSRTLVAGDLLIARGGRLRLCPASWLDDEDDFEAARSNATRALQLPLEAVAVSHGEPPLFEGSAALEEALRV